MLSGHWPANVVRTERMRVRAAWKVRAVSRDARDPYPSRRMIWLAGRRLLSDGTDVLRKTVLPRRR